MTAPLSRRHSRQTHRGSREKARRFAPRLAQSDLVDIVPEAPKTSEATAKLKTRTLTNLYNERPSWLDSAHAELDRAVASAYGWPEDISTEDALARLLALNLERAKKQ